MCGHMRQDENRNFGVGRRPKHCLHPPIYPLLWLSFVFWDTRKKKQKSIHQLLLKIVHSDIKTAQWRGSTENETIYIPSVHILFPVWWPISMYVTSSFDFSLCCFMMHSQWEILASDKRSTVGNCILVLSKAQNHGHLVKLRVRLAL